MENKNIIKHSSVLLETIDKRLIFHHRDDKPDIIHPDFIGTFGGGVEKGESFEDAAIRELREELNLMIEKNNLIFFSDHRKNLKNGEELQIRVFLLKDVHISKLILNKNEGQNIVIISKNDNWQDYKLTPLAREILGKYFK